MNQPQTYYGKYRGTVVNNLDPKGMGRIQVIIPDISNTIPSTWAMPCVPIADKQAGVYLVPQVGSGVWVEFEQGNPDYPIWVGGFWGSAAEVPTLAQAASPLKNILLQTVGQNTLVISDLPGPAGGAMLKSPTGASIIVNDTGIYIQNGQGASITLIGPTVAINGTALTVT